MYVFLSLSKTSWFTALEALREALVARDVEKVQVAYAQLYTALAESNAPDLVSVAGRDLFYRNSSLAHAAMSYGEIPAGLLGGARCDLEELLALLQRDWHKEVSDALGKRVPPLAELAPPLDPETLLDLNHVNAEEVLDNLVTRYAQHGAGLLARYGAFRWTDQHLEGIAHPAQNELSRLVGLERPLARLVQNTEAFLARKPAQHTLLYGPRGSGKSTAVRSLLPRFAERGLRLVELSVAHLFDLLSVIEPLRERPHRYILFIDDLSFGEEDTGYAPLKTLLEGSLTERPENVRVYATSNRRHLVTERFSDRPDPLNDDVHAWDTQHERLALADRFGLTLTFPDATQSRYLEIVRGLAAQAGLEVNDARAIRFAEWGNGYSGRTAQQFVETLLGELSAANASREPRG